MKSLTAFCVLVLALAPCCFAGSDKPAPEDLIKKAVDAFGSPDHRDPSGGRHFEGQVNFRNIVGGSGGLQGSAEMLSRGRQLHVTMNFSNPSYLSENILLDAEGRTTVGVITAGLRSNLGNFLEFQPVILRSGLFGGVLSTAFPFWQPSLPSGVKLFSDGLKKIDGEKLYEVRYQGPKQGDLNIYLYFDPETGRHVMTQYRLYVPAGSTGIITSPTGKDQTVLVQEKFSNFHLVNGVNLPLLWTIRWIAEESAIQEWQIVLQKLDPTLPPDAFEIKATAK